MVELTNGKKLKEKISKILLFIFLVMIILLMVVINYKQTKSFEELNQSINKNITTTIKHTLSNNTEEYRKLIRRVILTADVERLLANKQREKLYSVLKRKYDLIQKDNKDIKTLHIIDAKGNSFLRVHEKEKYGDNLVVFRPMVKEIIKSHKQIEGYEAGIYAAVFRIMVPLFFDNEYIGSIGIGIDPHYFADTISKIINKKGLFFLQDHYATLHKPENTLLINRYRLYTQIDKETNLILKKLPLEYNFENLNKFQYKDLVYSIYTEDILTFDGTVLGKYLFIDDITNILQKQVKTKYEILIILILILLVLFFIVKYYISRFIRKLDLFYNNTIKKIQENERYLKAVENGSTNLIVSSHDQEIFTVNKSFLQFTAFQSLDDFKKKHNCICDFFIPREGYLQKNIDGKYWLDYVLENPKKVHRVIMEKEGEKYIFSVTSAKLEIENTIRYVTTFVDITEIDEIKDRYEFAINGARDGIWDWNLLTDEVYFSPQWKQQIGYTDDEIENHLSTWSSRVHTDDKEQAVKDLNANIERKTEFYENIHRLQHKDGHWVWILDRGKTIFDENGKAVRMIGFHTDITQLKSLEQKIIKSQERFEMFMDNVPALITIKNKNGKIIYANKQINEFFKQDILGKDINSLFSIKEQEIFENIDKKALNENINKVITVHDTAGEEYIFRNMAFPITALNNEKEIGIIALDITKDYQIRKELDEKDKIMIAQSRHAAMGEMISMIAHQWRQPLSVISMGANNILADIELELVEEDNLRDISQEIIEQTNELSKIIDDFKEFFKPIKNIENISIHEVFDKAFKVISKSLVNNDVKVIENYKTDRKIDTYSRELMQVFINIINNAKEVLLENEIKNKEIVITVEENDVEMIVTISDNAGGVLNDNIEKIFEPYFSTKSQKSGTGLGLYMSKAIIEKHLHGVLQVYNKNGGACFEIRVPLEFKS